jgi:tRNA (mo5U34)-methyltransferase
MTPGPRARRFSAREAFSQLWGLAAMGSGRRQSPGAEGRRDQARVYDLAVEQFRRKTQHLDFPGLERFFWYHAVDLGDGLVTPGDYDYRDILCRFRFPLDMRGMRVLDIGSATGFFAFEFEKRGAHVTSVELPSISDWDMITGGDKERTLQGMMAGQAARDLDELNYLHLDGPFRFCCAMLNSKVSRCHATIYDLSAELLGDVGFDLVFVGDVLPHVFSPLGALNSVAPLCAGTLVISQGLARVGGRRPVMVYRGGGARRGDSRSWWQPNRPCISQMLCRVGFRTVNFVDEFRVTNRRNGVSSRRTVIHAGK